MDRNKQKRERERDGLSQRFFLSFEGNFHGFSDEFHNPSWYRYISEELKPWILLEILILPWIRLCLVSPCVDLTKFCSSWSHPSFPALPPSLLALVFTRSIPNKEVIEEAVGGAAVFFGFPLDFARDIKVLAVDGGSWQDLHPRKRPVDLGGASERRPKGE